MKHLRLPLFSRPVAPRVAAPPLAVIPNRWYAVLESRKLGAEPRAIQRFDENLVLWRDRAGEAVAMIDRCPHRAVALSSGRVVAGELECPYHGFRFAADGECTWIPCEDAAPRQRGLRAEAFVTREAHGLIWLWWGEARRLAELPELPWVAELREIGRSSSEVSFVWPVPDFRAHESVFDAHHAPVLHGRGLLARARKLDRIRKLETIDCRVEGDRIDLDGLLVDPDAPRERSIDFHVSFVFPGHTHLRVGGFLNLALFDTPIDASSTWRWTRYYNVVLDAPVIGPAIAKLMLGADLAITQWREDRPMVMSQELPAAHVHERLIAADLGIGRYHGLRRRLLAEGRAQADALPPAVRRHLPATAG